MHIHNDPINIMLPTLSPNPEQDKKEWVPETSFGKWFLSTNTWYRYVLKEAIQNLRAMLGSNCPENSQLLEVGCGQGTSIPLLDKYFKPESIHAVDIDSVALEQAFKEAEYCQCKVAVFEGSAKNLSLPGNSFDLIFCHQLLHHIAFQEAALQEFMRLLKPGGKLLISESCKPFLQVWWVRYFFRHPKIKQKTASGYIDLVRDAGFVFEDNDILQTTPWWSKRDFGILEKLGLQFWTSKVAEISIVASKPA